MNIKLVTEWRSWWRLWSTWFQVAAAAFISYLTVAPDVAIQVWQFLPADLRGAIPPEYVQFISVGLIILGIVARLIKQPKLAAEVKAQNEPGRPIDSQDV